MNNLLYTLFVWKVEIEGIRSAVKIGIIWPFKFYKIKIISKEDFLFSENRPEAFVVSPSKIQCQGVNFFLESNKMRFALKEQKITSAVSSDVF